MWWVGALGAAPSVTTGAGQVLDLGSQHPTRAGLVGLEITSISDIVTKCEIHSGFLHRGAEKLFEVRDYRQILMLSDRHDWLAPFNGELVSAMAVEQAMGLIPPRRAVVLRTLLAEVTRIASHLGFLSFPFHVVDPRSTALRAVRDGHRQLVLHLSGNRLHPMLNRLGGLAADANQAWLAALEAWLADVDALPLEQRVEACGFRPGLGLLDQVLIDQHGVSGPAARAAGLPRDLRRTPGYLAYPELDWGEPVLGDQSDVSGRFRQWVAEVRESTTLVRSAVELLAATDGPVDVKLSKIIKVPDCEVWLELEGPLGLTGVHLVSRGGTTPWRFKLRTPTAANVNILQQAMIGARVDEMASVVASMGWTIGDLDK